MTLDKACLILFWNLLLAGMSTAQTNFPILHSIDPPGLVVGAEGTLTLRGEHLARVDKLRIEGEGVFLNVKSVEENRVVATVRVAADAIPDFRALRVEGPTGISNARLVRLDRLVQTVERETNDTIETATPLSLGSAGVGTLGATDRDHFLVEGRQGKTVTIDVEARRLGLSISPVVTIFGRDGHSLRQARATPGVDGDCRFLWTVPADGPYVIQVRDNLYGSSDGAYRLRITDEPFATGVFPLGGKPGRPLTVVASGGNLQEPVAQTIELPKNPGALVELPPFQAFRVPFRILVDNFNGRVIDDRIERPGEVDRHRIAVHSGETVPLRIVAESLGSWLDSVITVRDRDGKVIAENDDASDRDSRLDFKAVDDAEITVEVVDRFGRGGPEFGYRLIVGPVEPDFKLSVTGDRTESIEVEPASDFNGALNLTSGSDHIVLLNLIAEGRTGPITIMAEGLPSGVSAEPLVVRPRAGEKVGRVPILLVLRSSDTAVVSSSNVRIKATATLREGEEIERLAEAMVPIGNSKGEPNGPGRRTVRWRIDEFPLKVIRPSRSDRP